MLQTHEVRQTGVWECGSAAGEREHLTRIQLYLNVMLTPTHTRGVGMNELTTSSGPVMVFGDGL